MCTSGFFVMMMPSASQTTTRLTGDTQPSACPPAGLGRARRTVRSSARAPPLRRAPLDTSHAGAPRRTDVRSSASSVSPGAMSTRTTPISHTREFVEERFGEAINVREQCVLPHLAAHGGFGPPDLCWLRKCEVDGAGGDDVNAEPQGWGRASNGFPTGPPSGTSRVELSSACVPGTFTACAVSGRPLSDTARLCRPRRPWLWMLSLRAGTRRDVRGVHRRVLREPGREP